LTILRQRKNEKAIVIGTKNLEWRAVLHSSSIEINAEILPVDLAKQGALCVAQLHLDILPSLGKIEALSEEAVDKQLSLERKFESESLQQFLDFANDWWAEYKNVRHSHKTRLVKIFAETDDREASVYKPVCSLI
jgi:centrosomal protein CEP76